MPFTRGGFTSVDGAVSSPAWSNSLSPRGSGADVMLMACAISKVASEQVNSPVSSMKDTASFLPSDENTTMIAAHTPTCTRAR